MEVRMHRPLGIFSPFDLHLARLPSQCKVLAIFFGQAWLCMVVMTVVGMELAITPPSESPSGIKRLKETETERAFMPNFPARWKRGLQACVSRVKVSAIDVRIFGHGCILRIGDG
uniref:Uncharacterized protein n=1 Tax=Bionectria ochroleuca TaxID=29856 RepID=A0A0B7JZD1_BIOOC